MQRVLIVEDEKDIVDVLAFNLRQAGFDVDAVGTGGDALMALEKRRPDLVLLDLMLPDMSGKEVCRTMRARAETAATPVLMLTARGEEVDRVVGFEVGADDYVVKPFSMRELLLRIQALLRRVSPEVLGPTIEFGDLRIDREAHRVWVSGTEIELTALEFKLLVTFYERRNRVQTRARLLDDVWGISADVTTRTVDTHVKRLREKLGRRGDFIETVRGVGYRFAATPTVS